MIQNSEIPLLSRDELETQFSQRVYQDGLDAFIRERFAETKTFIVGVDTIFGWLKSAVNQVNRLDVPDLVTEGKTTKIRDLHVTEKNTRRELTAKTGAFLTRRLIKLRFDSSDSMLPTRAAGKLEKAEERYIESEAYPLWIAQIVGNWSVFQGQRAAKVMEKALSKSDAQYVPNAAKLLKICAALTSHDAVPQPLDDVIKAEAGIRAYVEQRLPRDDAIIADPRDFNT